MNKFILALLLLCSAQLKSNAQDTLSVTTEQADQLFFAKNYYLLAAAMNVEASKAQVLQAKLYPNPIITADFNAYDPQNDKVLHAGKTGQKTFQFEQLIVMGGKRKVEIEMAKTNVAIAELQFQQLTRQLKFELHSNLFAIGQQQMLLDRYNSQMKLISSLLEAYQIQAEKGNIPLKDVVRLKGAYLNLNNNRAQLLKQYYETQAILQTLLQTSATVSFQFTEQEIKNYIKEKELDELKTITVANRPEILAMQQNKTLATQYISYQKKLAIPDINLFSAYDQRGGAFNNQINAGIAIPLPAWNRNQGNIKSSQIKLKEADYNLQATQNEILSNLQNSYRFYNQTVQEYNKVQKLYNQDFEITLKGMTDNFKKQNISIVEFIDFFEAYNDALTEITRIKTQLVLSGEQLNVLIGKDIY